MQVTDLGTVIAIRNLTGKDQDGQLRQATVVLGAPQQFPDSDDYFAPYRITGIGRDHIRYAAGIDAIQSLQLVITMIGADLFAFNKRSGHSLRWIGDESGDLGFPIP